jgi:hypothetical protein
LFLETKRGEVWERRGRQPLVWGGERRQGLLFGGEEDEEEEGIAHHL